MQYKRTPVTNYVVSRLAKTCPDYMLRQSDFQWLEELNRCHGKKKITNVSMVAAMREALPKEKDEYLKKADRFEAMCDPWELLIDAGICDTKCNPL